MGKHDKAGKHAGKRHLTFKISKKVFGFIRKHCLLALCVAVLLAGLLAYTVRPEDLGAELPPPPADALYKQASQPIDARVADLLGRMTLEEKIGQMALVDKNSLGRTEDIRKYYLGGILSGAGAKPRDNTPEGWRKMVTEMKQQAAGSRLGIPILFGVDANHGHGNVPGATIFPHSIGLGASRDSALAGAVAQTTAEELKATGINWTYSPALDAPKDIRWGRVYEAFSDDPVLNGALGSAFISGSGKDILTTAKHYLGNGSMLWGQSNHKRFQIDQGKARGDDYALDNEHLPPYKAAIAADVGSVMIGLNEWNGQRVIENHFLLTEKLKDELGFKGFTVTDWYGVYEYSKYNDYRSNVVAFNAGLDMAMLPYDYKAFMTDMRRAVKSGEISQQRIDDAVSRILYQKFKTGLFDNPRTPDLATVGSESHRQLARSAAAKSAVLLKNDGSVLPLPEDTGSIVVAGSGADNIGRQCGAWTVEWQGIDGNWLPGATSILSGIRQAAGPNTEVQYDKDGNFSMDQKADVGIVVVSEKPYAEGWGDNPNPAIEEADLKAIEKVRSVSEKVVVVMVSGRPLFITEQIGGWDAAVAAWLPGSEGGGVADVLFGSQPFTGSLPLPWPADAEQLPIGLYGTANGSSPLFDRGHGL
jgi:beta-glucosidase